MIAHPAYRHGVLVHDTDEELDEGVRAFVDRGLSAGADVLVHATGDRLDGMRRLLRPHPRLSFGIDEELYQEPTRTLFAYQRSLAARSQGRKLWVTGTVPLGRDLAAQAAWHRYECVVDETLDAYPFVALCTYDTRTRPDWVIAAALATHRTVNAGKTDRRNPSYVEPAIFLATPLAGRPRPPSAAPAAVALIEQGRELSVARGLVETVARWHSAVSNRTIERLRIAVSEVAANGLRHGRPPVRVALWAEVERLTCLIEDSGPGRVDPMTGYRHPEGAAVLGMWTARQLVDELFITDSPTGGCRVQLSVTDRPD